jgi:PmbA protein
MNLDPLFEALRTVRADGHAIAAWSIAATDRRRMSLGVKDRHAGGAHAPMEVAESCAARYLLVWTDGHVSKGSLERRQLEREPAAALAAARATAFDDPDAAYVASPAPLPEVAMHDAAAAAMAAGDASLLARRLSAVRERVERAGFRTWSGSFSAVEATSRTCTSEGVDATERGTATGWHVTFEGEYGDGHSGRAPDRDDAFEARLDRLVATVERLRGPEAAVRSGIVPVLLHPNVVEEYVLDTLFHNLDGAAVAHGESAFGLDAFGSDRPVLREDLALRLDPLLPLRSGAYRISGEGVPASRISFVEGGRLSTPVLDLKYARRLSRPPTAIPYAMDAVRFEGEHEAALPAALSRASGGLLVLHVLGVHTQDPSSGDFSLSAPQSLAVSDGSLGGRVRATISGNLFDLLRRDDTAFVRFEGETTPGLLVRCRVA